ncbi:MAG: RNA-guided pseudouridylation complex pseudouridine synthase subunit Cbf5 [Nanoarchaeota archaeon]|nr:RNA-guided pseudouridylation complex pseudouridine synthase subunit Cbf5 [Nanoarchaeota archaeon]MBU0963135.1 RNA-guided pseudouridylation complex pseudouridine synthase subunit Cbf5 [Nanoarchaeota archaeon]
MEELPFEKIKRTILIKRKESTDSKYGCIPEKRSVEELINRGIICLNKPEGPTSHIVSEHVKKILNCKKSAHGGTLDPRVSGVLPIMINKSVKLSQYLLLAGKEYVALMHLHKDVEKEEIIETSKEFIGKIEQQVPVKSAVKRQKRFRNVYYLKILEIDGKDVLFKVGCEAGTYIRTLIHNWGQKLKVGANMQQLVRTKAGPFNDKEWYSLQDLQDAFLDYKENKNEKELRRVIKPYEYAVSHLPKIWVFDATVDPLCHGSRLNIPGISKIESDIKKDDAVAVFTLKNELIGVGKSELTSEEIIKNEKGIAINMDIIGMDINVYPKYKKE